VTTFSYHVSHEQFSPRALLGLVQHAEQTGFDAAFSSDHLHPWSSAQGESGFTWSWLGAALQATTRLTFAGITVPGGWLEEAAEIIRRLLAGERVSADGPIVCENAQVWSRPEHPIGLVGAAMSEATAERVGRWADGLLTTARHLDPLERIVSAFRRTAGDKPVHLKVDVSWARSEQAAVDQAFEQWRFLQPGRKAAESLATPEDFERAASSVEPEDMRECVLISSSLDQHVEWLRERIALGFETIDLHNVGRNQCEFIDAFSGRVLPALRSAR
jgi:coenzyme F420-dependent glucose-6-phosphate dehydrogenase